jgi:hypothetical protein
MGVTWKWKQWLLAAGSLLAAGRWPLAAGRWPLAVGAPFTFFNTLQSHPAVVLYVYLCAKSTIRNAQHDLGGIL